MDSALSSLTEIFPRIPVAKLSKYLQSYTGERIEGLLEIILSESGFSCGICFENDLLMDSVVSCPEGHFFCKDCASKGIEGQGLYLTSYKCFQSTCREVFEVQTLQSLLCPKRFSRYVQQLCKKEVESSSLKLEQCPECDFGVLIENNGVGDVLECQYEFCRVRSCRLCKRQAHPPGQLCNQKTVEQNLIDNKMSEAVIRKCYSCSKPFQKMEGCNSVTCHCGATMCYVCRTPIHKGRHERKSSHCGMTDMRRLHDIERTEAEKEALNSIGGSSKENLDNSL